MLLKDVASRWRRWLVEAVRCLGEAATRRRCTTAAGAVGAAAVTLLALYLLCAPTAPQAQKSEEWWGPPLDELTGGRGSVCGDVSRLLVADDTRSTCGAASDRRGPHQKVAAFCFYGDVAHPRGYFKGIAENAALLATLLPGWVMRVYHEAGAATGEGRNDSQSTLEALTALQARFPHLDLCDATDLPPYGDLSGRSQMLWRILPAADPLVDVFISRDLDSRLSSREAAAVQQWLESGLTFHVMRDNLQHYVPVMGGMWGARPQRRRSELRLLVDVVVACRWGAVDDDQFLLASFLWPVMRGDVLQHDSYYCEVPSLAEHGNMAPFPTRRQGHSFVGNPEPSEGTDHLEAEPCPEACRPPDHLDWNYC